MGFPDDLSPTSASFQTSGKIISSRVVVRDGLMCREEIREMPGTRLRVKQITPLPGQRKGRGFLDDEGA